MDYLGVMALPMKVFWHLTGSIERLLADEQKQLLELLATSHNPEAANQLQEVLHKRSPAAIKYSGHAIVQATAVRDEGAADQLRALAG